MSDYARIRPLALAAAELAQRTGIYEVESRSDTLGFRHKGDTIVLRVTEAGGSLQLRQDNAENPLRLVPVEASRFTAEGWNGPISVEFVRNYSGAIDRLIVSQGGQYQYEAKKLATGAR